MASTRRQAIYIEGLPEVMATLRSLPKEIRQGTDQLVRGVANFVADETRAAASTRAEVKAATTIKAQKNSVSLGGGGRTNRAGNMTLGTEFGGGARPSTQQFRPHRGTQGYFFWPAIRANSATIRDMWDQLVDDAVRRAAAGG